MKLAYALTYYSYYSSIVYLKQKIVVTNLRIPEEDWLTFKDLVASEKLSANESLKFIIQSFNLQMMLGIEEPKIRLGKKRKTIFQALKELAKKPYKHKPMGASEEDKIIYDIK